MTLNEAVKAINELGDDEEISHSQADSILCKYLEGNGAKELSDAFNQASKAIGFWYA